MSDTITEQTAVERKAELRRNSSTKTWHFENFADGPAAATLLNVPPPQVAGEASATANANGTIGMFFFL